ncbi:MAG TPA: hypothetical protein VGJ82_08950 [Thermoanaerobaculia bacterium]
MAEQQADIDSTLIRRGKIAMTYSDMVAFAESVETRPLAKVLEELAGIASLSDSKFRIASTVLRRRFQLESPIEQIQLRVIADEIASAVEDRVVANRIRDVFHIDHA